MSGFSAATDGSDHTMHYSKKIYKIGDRKITFVIRGVRYEHSPCVIFVFEKDEKFLSDSERERR